MLAFSNTHCAEMVQQTKMLKTNYSNGWGGCGVRGLMVSLRPAPAATNVTFFWIRHALKKGRFFGKENGFKVRSKIQ